MPRATAVECQRKLDEIQRWAQREPTKIPRHGRRELVLMSVDRYNRLVAASRRTSDGPAILTDVARRSEMDPSDISVGTEPLG